MSYRVYIKNDYKPEIRWYPDQPWYLRKKSWLISLGIISIACSYYLTEFPDRINISHEYQLRQKTITRTEIIPAGNVSTTENISGSGQEFMPSHEPEQMQAGQEQEEWQSVTIKSRDNLSIIFDRLHLSPSVLYQVISSGEDTRLLKRLIPGDQIHLLLKDGELQALRYEPDLTTTLLVTREDGKFKSGVTITELDTRIRETGGVIRDSLYLTGQSAGLTDNLIMRLVGIYGWDIDFALDIRAGDEFKVIYEEKYKQDNKVGDGPILAAEFINRGRVYRAVRYTAPDGQTGYYNEDGYSMRKAFLRTPLKFSYISSGFNLKRKHPILNRIRAHKGVDYAAPTGTPVKATGDGIVIRIGRNGGYGNMIVLRHGGIYNTAYAHLSRYAKGLNRGDHVTQGDIIGYVGMTGLATGPHLHYEFRVNGVHQNPLTIKLPKALRIPDGQLAHFQELTRPLLAYLDNYGNTEYASKDSTGTDDLVLAMDESSNPETPLR